MFFPTIRLINSRSWLSKGCITPKLNALLLPKFHGFSLCCYLCYHKGFDHSIQFGIGPQRGDAERKAKTGFRMYLADNAEYSLSGSPLYLLPPLLLWPQMYLLSESLATSFVCLRNVKKETIQKCPCNFFSILNATLSLDCVCVA